MIKTFAAMNAQTLWALTYQLLNIFNNEQGEENDGEGEEEDCHCSKEG